jgi:hypothetical protein
MDDREGPLPETRLNEHSAGVSPAFGNNSGKGTLLRRTELQTRYENIEDTGNLESDSTDVSVVPFS